MPMNGAGVTSWPPNTTAIPNTTIESGKYNAFLADLLSIMNTPRPITMGGTGASSAVGGNDALHTTSSVIASAATTDLAAATGVSVTVSGAAVITALGVLPSGVLRFLTFSGAATLTHNAATLILPGAANIVAAAGDTAVAQSLGGGNWRFRSYIRASGQPVAVISDANLPARLGVVAKTITDWNTALDNGWYMGSGAANAPAANTGWNIGTVEAHGAAGYRTQTVYDFVNATAANTTIWRRYQNGGVWGAWFKIQWSQAEQDARYVQSSTALLQKAYESAQQTITAGGTLTLAHGLGVKPKLYIAVIQCTTADLAYSIGDEVAINPMLNTTDATVQAISMVPDTTNLNVRIGANSSSLRIMAKSGASLTNITNTSWRLVFRAWA
ncbi:MULTISPECIES: pyocin knob domain-containing protein [unclassified Mesorhizobium]|uniref:pyocin knob domain-containing protein n=1 Tax=unclassified Mesorhizobium TaxID=325217 RepID=UPI0012EC78D1|nr:pyocin knob domain-containing protein [Mesorhizobium sp. LSJC268A00]